MLEGYVPSNVITNKNRNKSWLYGYDPKYDMVIISKTGMIGDIINIKGLVVALPASPKDVYKRSKTSSEQYWQRNAIPKPLERITSIFQWNEKPTDFKNLWVDYRGRV